MTADQTPLTDDELEANAPGERQCSIEGCSKPHLARGWCLMHYTRWRRNGDPLETQRPELISGTVEDRFWVRVADPDENGCRKWTGSLGTEGYGKFWLNGRMVGAYQVAWELVYGPVPEGMELDHVKARGCRSRACVAVEHLEPVPKVENIHRGDGFGGVNFRKTHCIRDHEFTPENTRIQIRRENGRERQGRICRTCERDRAAARRKSSQNLAPESPRPPAEVHAPGSTAETGSTGVPEPEKPAQTSGWPDVDGWTLLPHPDGIGLYHSCDSRAFLTGPAFPVGAVLAYIADPPVPDGEPGYTAESMDCPACRAQTDQGGQADER